MRLTREKRGDINDKAKRTSQSNNTVICDQQTTVLFILRVGAAIRFLLHDLDALLAGEDLYRLAYAKLHDAGALFLALRHIAVGELLDQLAAAAVTVLGFDGIRQLQRAAVAVGDALAGLAATGHKADAHGSARHGTTEATRAAKPPGEAGGHGESVIAHLKAEVFTQRVNDGFRSGEAVVKCIHGVVQSLLEGDLFDHKKRLLCIVAMSIARRRKKCKNKGKFLLTKGTELVIMAKVLGV